HADRPAVGAAVAGDHAVAEDLLLLHAEVGAAVGDELVELDEAAIIDQRRDALARGELAGLVLLGDARLAAGELGFRLHVFEALNRVAGHRPRIVGGRRTSRKRSQAAIREDPPAGAVVELDRRAVEVLEALLEADRDAGDRGARPGELERDGAAGTERGDVER